MTCLQMPVIPDLMSLFCPFGLSPPIPFALSRPIPFALSLSKGLTPSPFGLSLSKPLVCMALRQAQGERRVGSNR